MELAIATPLILIAAGTIASTMLANASRKRINSQNAVAATAAQTVLEEMRNETFGEVFALYNVDPFDDPLGPGTAPGSSFAVEGLTPLPDDVDGLVGEVVFPVTNTGGAIDPQWELREDAVLPALGLPRDLSGDHVIDDLDHAQDYRLLPVQVVVAWQGELGPRTFRMHTVLADWSPIE